eukprot:1141630-Pelagomonas_calceolata.AAC.5
MQATQFNTSTPLSCSAQDGGVFFLAGAAPGAFTDISESVTAAKSRVFLVREGILVPLLRETLVDFVTLEDALENLQVRLVCMLLLWKEETTATPILIVLAIMSACLGQLLSLIMCKLATGLALAKHPDQITASVVSPVHSGGVHPVQLPHARECRP